MEKTKVGAFLQELRIDQGLTVESLSEILQVENSYIYSIEDGSVAPSAANLEFFSKLYDVSIEEILNGAKKKDLKYHYNKLQKNPHFKAGLFSVLGIIGFIILGFIPVAVALGGTGKVAINTYDVIFLTSPDIYYYVFMLLSMIVKIAILIFAIILMLTPNKDAKPIYITQTVLVGVMGLFELITTIMVLIIEPFYAPYLLNIIYTAAFVTMFFVLKFNTLPLNKAE